MGETGIEALLAATEVFGTLPPADLALCAQRFRPVQFAAGQVLFSQGDPGTTAYLIDSGQVRLAIATPAGRELSVRIAERGALIGEIAAFDGGPRSAGATALTAVAAHAIGDRDFDRLFETNSRLARSVVHYLCRRLRATTDQLEGIALHRLEVRLARFLLDQLGGRTAVQGRRLSLELGYSQGELARLLGSSRPKVNLALGALEQAGAIKRTSDRLFCDPALLAHLAEGEDD